MGLGKVLLVTVIVAAATSAATFFALRTASGPGLAREVQVPGVTGLRLEEARSMLEARSLLLAISDSTEGSRLEAGRVVRQSPQGGSSLRAGGEVRLVLSAGQPRVEVPSLLHLPLGTATELLTGAGLTTGQVRRVEDAAPPGQVIAARPAPGERLSRGSVVELSVSAGPPPVKVPSLVGRTQEQARELLGWAGLELGQVTFGYDEDRRAGVVIRQAPAAEGSVARGSAVNLVLNESD